MGWTALLADKLGGTEAGLKLILGQLAGYPVLLLYRKLLSDKDPKLQHVYFALTGLFLGHWVIGPGVTHGIYAILFTYLLLVIAGGTFLSVVISFIFNIAYLLIGYWHTASEEYDISWTMPQCVLCLRLIGLTVDVYDGNQAKLEKKTLSKEQEKNCLVDNPSIIEMLSHSFFIGGYFVGPQFSMRKFRDFATPEYHKTLPSSPSRFGFRRLLIGVAYLIGHVVGSQFYPEDWPDMDSYAQTSYPAKLIGLMFWVKIILAKYVSIWLMAEGVCVVSGLSYVGNYSDGSPDWTGCRNVKLRRLETATQFGHYIEAFNINTNGWAANYVYKRLKFMNNKLVSQVVTLVFLAIWHGWYIGYYLTFVNEFIVMKFEAEFSKIWNNSKKVQKWKHHPSFHTLTSIFGWLYVHFFLAHCFLPFPLKTAHRIFKAYTSLFFVHLIFYLGWPLWAAPLKKYLQYARASSHEGGDEKSAKRRNSSKDDNQNRKDDISTAKEDDIKGTDAKSVLKAD
eukprot:TRINITY_DN9328_c0_g1_i8.p1 TRINITY_DN9328_c0_g1~~TRINITY_DN9328_c0_g1_i8.p1  ORF type:complete len:507 (+),score=73.62 TRINITY_DN9328_c0_g1_i8:78-1598(+)